MAGSPMQPSFRRFASHMNEPAKKNLDHRDMKAPEQLDGPIQKPEKLTEAPYQDPRDELDQERHAIFAKARQERDGIANDPSESKER